MPSKEIVDRAQAMDNRLAKRAEESHTEFLLAVTNLADEIKKAVPTPPRHQWLEKVINELLKEQDYKCAMCKADIRDSRHVDHIIPHVYGGGNERGNIQLLCPSCNLKKGKSVCPADLLRYLEDRFMNRP